MSVGSSIYERVMENGRSYHHYKQGSKFKRLHVLDSALLYFHTYYLLLWPVEYPLPNDEVSKTNPIGNFYFDAWIGEQKEEQERLGNIKISMCGVL